MLYLSLSKYDMYCKHDLYSIADNMQTCMSSYENITGEFHLSIDRSIEYSW